MKQIIKMEFGSRVYGTALPSSDTDYKSIFIPDPEDLVMQRASKHINSSTKRDNSQRNTADDVDDEGYSIQTYMELIRQGQTVALDMLFTPEPHYLDKPDRLWMSIREQKADLLHSGTNAFVGYTKAQAAKYGNKGERVEVLRKIVDLLKTYDGNEFLGYYSFNIREIVETVNSKEMELVSIPTPSGPDGVMEDLEHLSVANKKVPFTCTVSYALTVYKLALNKYGHRALLAEKNQGVDWKACMHAVRIAAEAKELLLTGHITFPRPERELLLQIRKGELAYKQVEELIEQGLTDINQAQSQSTLREKPNHALMERIVSEAHWGTIKRYISRPTL